MNFLSVRTAVQGQNRRYDARWPNDLYLIRKRDIRETLPGNTVTETGSDFLRWFPSQAHPIELWSSLLIQLPPP